MNPLDKKIEDLEKRLKALERVENVPFIKTLIRRFTYLVSNAESVPTSITTSVRNAAGTGTTNVAAVPDGKLEIELSNGTIKYIAVYDS
jgi:hypothetical protein